MKRYTKPVNIRFETPVDNKLREIKQRDSQCRRELVKVGYCSTLCQSWYQTMGTQHGEKQTKCLN